MPSASRPQMADYGVPVDDSTGLLDWRWAVERLQNNRNYWLSTASADGRPHTMPVWGVWLTDPDRFWFGSAPSAKKLRNIAANPRVAVATDNTVEVVSVQGNAHRVETGAPEVVGVVDAFVAKYWDQEAQRREQREALLNGSWTVVEPIRAFGVIEREAEFGPTATRWRWH